MTPFISDFDLYLFGKGTHYEIYEKLGAHAGRMAGRPGFHFAVWAPHARRVCVIGDFNGWRSDVDKLERLAESGVFYGFVPGARPGEKYKFEIVTAKGERLRKADPFGFACELRPLTASVLYKPAYKFRDKVWMKRMARQAGNRYDKAMSVYEVHLPSWRRHPRPEADGFYNYREAARALGEYVSRMGYTHVELIGIAEHPLDASWGYQVTGYYAPTSRCGSPDDFKYFVDYMHACGIGVIIDWVPAHFPRDAHGLGRFDGEPLFEHPDPRRGEHPDWGTYVFDHGQPQVSNFLIANALFWLREYHVDGLRVDAVASMLYLDFGRKPGQWLPNAEGGHENTDAIEFFKHLNSIIALRHPGAVTIAEESTAWPGVTESPEKGGLGFSYKWNMGWMHDFLEYLRADPVYRSGLHEMMAYTFDYAFSEKFILEISHDEVVHLKKSVLEKQTVPETERFAALRAAYAFMMLYPGKKLLFMGQEFGQRREWCEDRELDWFLLQDERHESLRTYVAQLLALYAKCRALHETDAYPAGFSWINREDRERSIFSFMRYSRSRREKLLCIVNFTPTAYPDFRIGVPHAGSWRLLADEMQADYLRLAADETQDGYRRPAADETFAPGESRIFETVRELCDYRPYALHIPIAPYGVALLRHEGQGGKGSSELRKAGARPDK